jgi:hypothetical protein
MLLFWKMYGLGLLGLLACTLSNRRINIFIFGFIVVLSLQLIKGGGGFMYARLALPILIYLLIALELWASTRIPSRWYPIAALICGVLFVIAPYPEEVRDGNAQGIVEEKDWYPVEAIEEGRSLGEELQTFLEGTDARIAILGAQAMVAYYAKAPFVLESMAGLTDRELARMPVQKKRIGHGQKATLEYMRQREIDVLLIYRNRVSAPPETLISLGNVEGVLIRYRSVLLNEWKKRGARFVDIPTLIDTSVQDEEDVQKLQELGSFLDLFYFGPSEDIQRQKELTKKISNLQE